MQDLVNGIDNIAQVFKGRLAIDLDVDRQSITICRLRIWPDPALLAKFEPELDMLRARAANVRSAERICP